MDVRYRAQTTSQTGTIVPHHHVSRSQPHSTMDDDDDAQQPPSEPSGLSAMRERSGLQDRLVNKLLQQVIPSDGDSQSPDSKAGSSPFPQRPGFNLTTMSYNFRHFNARIGVVFRFQAKAERLLSWRRPTQTLSMLAVYSFVCLDPHLLPVLPLVVLLLGVLVPAFVARHPAPPKGTLSSEQAVGYSPHGPPLAPPAPTVRPPAKELSRDFFRNMRDLQNSMADFSHAHDRIVKLVVPVTDFSDEALSSTVFHILVVAALVMALAAHIVPWRLVFFVGGWSLVLARHPSIKPLVRGQFRRPTPPKHLDDNPQRRDHDSLSLLDRWTASDVILDSAPETREAEIFELQRADPDAAAWEPWLFSPEPYDPLSPSRIAGHRPRGSRFFEDVLPPPGWHWSEKKWALDLWSREWVEDRIITGVEVETEGERWVYDMFDDRQGRIGVVDYSQPPKPPRKHADASAQPSWEEGDDEEGGGRRGEWRRRRWVRLVKRRAVLPSAATA
ncbi:Peroxisomal membrane protein PEX29 [Ophiocordyceps camponoti-floridani]|uniref:Peroxisomal membrane protein PEX29 n=1 Tax=Ophiocordyceps camponoti-floridani TaxID=2030778 RepID=A0A8H4Q9N8_9HYPO|nr:Peroxisomal membrane protein PEX29 [Ophiocordyceps camponoti-floridani]